MTKRFLSSGERREEDERIQSCVMGLVQEFEQVDTGNIGAITGQPHQEEDGLEDDLALFFDTSPNGIKNALLALRGEGQLAFTSQKGGPEHDPRHIISRIALPREVQVQ